MKINIVDDIMYISAEDNMYITQNNSDISIQNIYYSKQIIVSSKCDPNIFRDATQEEKAKYDTDLAAYMKSVEDSMIKDENPLLDEQETN